MYLVATQILFYLIFVQFNQIGFLHVLLTFMAFKKINLKFKFYKNLGELVQTHLSLITHPLINK